MKLRELAQSELERVWSIDRAEVVENVYHHVGGGLVLVPEHHDVAGWPVGEPEHYGPILRDCLDHGGACYGAFEGETLVGAAVLESRFIGLEKDQLQLKFLHVSRSERRGGLGVLLFEQAVGRARELGARWLYISATSSENTVDFYLSRGCQLVRELDAALFELEPKDIHLEFAIPDASPAGDGDSGRGAAGSTLR